MLDWGEGHTNKAPVWYNVLGMAEDWGIPPWRIEDEVPYHWYEKWFAKRQADARRIQTRPNG